MFLTNRKFNGGFNKLDSCIIVLKLVTLGMIHIWRPWQLSNFQYAPPLLSIYVQNVSTPLVQLQTIHTHTHTPLQVITDQLKENVIQWWIIYAIRSFFQIGFHFKYQLINLLWLSFDFFSFSWSVTICFFMALNSCVCSWAKISRNVLYLQLFTFLVLILQSTYFICATWKLKQTMEQQPHHACDRTKSKHKNKVSSNSN